MKAITILGSTGSIGRQALNIVDQYPKEFRIVGLAVRNNIKLLEQQIYKYKPLYVAVEDEDKAQTLKKIISNTKVEVFGGKDSLSTIVQKNEHETILVAVVGFSGLVPTIEAIKNKKTIALANKETLVAGGKIVTELAKEKGVSILPVDSEHSAIFQCLQGQNENEVRRVILTASGGPFREWSKEEMKNITPSKALKHPNWEMGRKITIDSATLMNKGLEVIEAHWLFNIDYDHIDVVIHPQSIIHSLVEFKDGAQLAQLGHPDMALPIQYAFTFPDRWARRDKSLNLTEVGKLTFENPNNNNFPCLALAYEAGKIGGTMPTVLNAANEVVVNNFLLGKVNFLAISHIIEKVMSQHKIITSFNIEDLENVDQWAREQTLNALTKGV